jgi:hypothetical protein
MIRGENVICGTTTSGFGTLTLAACPSPPGGVDFFATFGAWGLGTTQTTLVPYVIIEYTDQSFSTASGMEKGWGSLLLGASISACTLARTLVQFTCRNLNTSTPTPIAWGSANVVVPTPYVIGTANRTLVFIGASASDLPAWSCPILLPSTVTNYDNRGAGPFGLNQTSGAGGAVGLNYGQDCYFLFLWVTPMLVKKVFTFLATADVGSTTNNLYVRLYSIGSDGRPGKLLYDFGLVGTANASLKTTGMISSAVGSQGVWLTPGEYFLDFAGFQTGTATGSTPKFGSSTIPFVSGRTGTFGNFGQTAYEFTATGAVSGTAPDPANVTAFACTGSLSMPVFSLKDAA